jgi:general secretion pathway protein F
VLFAELGGTLPLSTKILVAASSGLKSYGWILLLALTAGGIGFKSLIQSGGGRLGWDRLKLKLMGEVIRKLETARFCRTLGTLLNSGVPMLQALQNAKEVVNNQLMAQGIGEAAQGVKEGKGMALTLSSLKVLPPLALSMIQVGEETGQLEAMLIRVAQTYEKSLKVSIKRLVSFVEPAMILGMGLLIGFIVLSMLMAIFSVTDLPL